MQSLLEKGMVPFSVVGQTSTLVYRYKGDGTDSSGAAIFGREWSGKIVEFRVDNMAVVHAVNTTFCSDGHLMHLIRLLVFFASYHNF